MPAPRNLTGVVSGRLTALRWDGHKTGDGKRKWLCVCVCGAEVLVSGSKLAGRTTRSCGCLKRDGKHGDSSKKSMAAEYRSWSCMRARCLNKNHPNYPRYGGRGITICARWDNYSLFLEDVGRKPGPDYTLDRIDVAGDYEPANVRWATRRAQQNNRRNTVMLTVDGTTKPLAVWAREYKISRAVCYTRIFQKGWPAKSALTTPPGAGRPGRK